MRAFRFFPFFPQWNRRLVENRTQYWQNDSIKIENRKRGACARAQIYGCEMPPSKHIQTADEPNYNKSLLNSRMKLWRGRGRKRRWWAVGETDKIIKLRWRCASINPINKMFILASIQSEGTSYASATAEIQLRWKQNYRKPFPVMLTSLFSCCSIGIRYKNFLCFSCFPVFFPPHV